MDCAVSLHPFSEVMIRRRIHTPVVSSKKEGDGLSDFCNLLAPEVSRQSQETIMDTESFDLSVTARASESVQEGKRKLKSASMPRRTTLICRIKVSTHLSPGSAISITV